MLTKRLRQSGVVVSCLLGSVLFIALAFLGWQRFAPAATVSGWTYRVVLEDIPHVSALARDPDGLLYVSQELQDGKGLVFRIAADGSRDTVLDGLSKPDGMASFRDGIAISQEQGASPVFWWHASRPGRCSTASRGRASPATAATCTPPRIATWTGGFSATTRRPAD